MKNIYIHYRWITLCLLCCIQGLAYGQKSIDTQVAEVRLCGNYTQVNNLYNKLLQQPVPREQYIKVEQQNYMGQLALRLSKFADAKKHFRKAIELSKGLDESRQYLPMLGYMGFCKALQATEEWDVFFENAVNAPNCAQTFIGWIGTRVKYFQKNQRLDVPKETFADRYSIMFPTVVLLNEALANISLWLKSYDETIGYLQEGLNTLEQEKLSLPLLQLELLDKLAYARKLTGQYEEALKDYQQCAEKSIFYCGEQSTRYAVTQLRISDIYLRLGNFEQTEYHLKKAVQLFRKNGEQQTVEYAELCFLLAQSRMSQKKYDDALALLQHCLQLQNKLFSPNAPVCLRTQIYIGDAYAANGQQDKAEALFDKLYDMQDAYVYNMIDFAHIIRSYSELLITQGIYKEASELMEAGMDAFNTLPESDPLVLRSFYNLAGYAFMMNEAPDKAITYYEKQLAMERKQAHDIFAFLPETQRAGYWAEIEASMNRLFLANREGAIIMKGGTVLEAPAQNKNQTSTLLYDASLLNKGIMLEASVNLSRIIRQSKNVELEKLYNELSALRRQLTATQEATISTVRNEQIKRAEALESLLITRSREYGDYMKFTSITWKEVQSALKADETAIEFICSKENGIDYYSAELLRTGYPKPQHLFLLAVPQNEDWLTDEQNYQNTRLTDRLWKKIIPYIKPNETIYFAPAGQLYNVGIEYLPINDNTRMNERYRMVRLSSTRELVLHRPTNQTKNAVLYGGLNYNTELNDMMLYAANFNTERDSKRSFNTDQGIKRNIWNYLKGTRREVDEVEQQLTRKNYSVRKYIGSEGVEESFKALSGQKLRILHIATHGFYLPKEEQSANSTINRLKREDTSLNRSGLIFAGANNAWLNRSQLPEALDDGILTAQEISQLNFAGTDLVVMSACQTGLGDVTSEGVFGLQRAFKQAGVQTLLMSLWPVNDEATQVMMTEFYKQLSTGCSKRNAFYRAQQKVKASTFQINDKSVSGKHPSFWAAFVMMD